MAKTKAKAKAPVKSKEELEKEADIARKAAVDAANKASLQAVEDKATELANTPLSAEERAFIARVRPMMNQGRRDLQPSPADITIYSRLLPREHVK